MSIFATEFQVTAGISRAAFVAAVVAWLRGIDRSKILDSADSYEDYEDEVWLETADGETLSIKSFEDDRVKVWGARLEIPDNLGRNWRTECVMTDFGEEAYLRVRGQCVATDLSASVVSPKKPHFIRQAIEDGWCVADGQFLPSISPVEIAGSDMDLAAASINGTSGGLLPTLYVSRGNQEHLAFDATYVAKQLAGICHVVVEPSRAFSFSLMEVTRRKNPFGGAIALISADGKQQFKLFRRIGDEKGRELARQCILWTNSYVSSLAARKSWEWQDLQEAQSKRLRASVKAKASGELDEYIAVFDSEITAKDEKISDLQARLALAEAKSTDNTSFDGDLFQQGIKERIGPELYDGEFSDRLRAFLEMALSSPGKQRNSRTDKFIELLLQELKFTGGANSLISQIKSACRDGKQMPKQLGALLAGFGFSKSTEGPHIKYQPPQDLFGLQMEVLPSTPSDSQRGGKNRGSEVIRAFGLNELK